MKSITSSKIDFDALNRAALPLSLPICRRLFPNGIMKGKEYFALAPHRADRRLGSFAINLRTGKWADFATGDKGGDLCSLIAFVYRFSQPEAARALATLIGFDLKGGCSK
jgi:hypothetical protein